MDASAEFYSELFGWKIEPFEGTSMPYMTIQNQGHGNGGMRAAQENEPCYWLVYFGSGDIEADTSKATGLGGNALTGAMDIGVGKISVVQDPQGAVFALYAGQFED
jgi:predicted enzyme related to lactoylglutathione lyase